MLDVFRGLRALLALVIAIATSTALYWNHVNRAVREGELCRSVEKHVAKLNTGADGKIRDDAMDLILTIESRCEQYFSKSQARCILKAQAMDAVRACNG